MIFVFRLASSTEQAALLQNSEKNPSRDSHENASEERDPLENPTMYTDDAVPGNFCCLCLVTCTVNWKNSLHLNSICKHSLYSATLSV